MSNLRNRDKHELKQLHKFFELEADSQARVGRICMNIGISILLLVGLVYNTATITGNSPMSKTMIVCFIICVVIAVFFIIIGVTKRIS